MNKPRIIAYYPDFCGLFDGCVSCAVLLSQLVYWHGEGKDGKPRYNVSDNEGNFWLAKSFTEWHQETGITRDKFERALTRLRDRGIITTAVMRFAGSPTLHVRFLALKGQRKTITAEQIVKDHMQLSDSHVAIPANANADNCNFTTETTSKTTAESKPAVPSAHANPAHPGEEQPKCNEGDMGMVEVLNDQLVKEELKQPAVAVEAQSLVVLWKKGVQERTGECQLAFTGKERGQLKKIADLISEEAKPTIRWVIKHWQTFGAEAQLQQGTISYPPKPHVGYLLENVKTAYSLYTKYRKGNQYAEPKIKGNAKGNMPPEVNPWTGKKASEIA